VTTTTTAPTSTTNGIPRYPDPHLTGVFEPVIDEVDLNDLT